MIYFLESQLRISTLTLLLKNLKAHLTLTHLVHLTNIRLYLSLFFKCESLKKTFKSKSNITY